MKRRLLTILLFLLAGAVVNVAVAWGIALLGEMNASALDSSLPQVQHVGARSVETTIRRLCGRLTVWQEWVPLETDSRPTLDEEQYTDLLPPWSVFADHEPLLEFAGRTTPYADLNLYVELATGWPMLSFHGSLLLDPNAEDHSGPDGMRPVRQGILVLPPSMRMHEHLAELPFLPIWPGFAVNTLFYAAILWLLLLAGPRMVRRELRRRRGRCLKCGYDLRGVLDQGCPECGWNREEGV